MSTFINNLNNQIQNNRSLLDILLGQKTRKKTKNAAVRISTNCGKRDTVTISSAGQEMSVNKVSSGRTHNTKIDSSIDLQSYIDAARKSNEYAIANAGNEINARAVPHTSIREAFYDALTEKYSKLLSEAKRHSNPESYIFQKYFNESSEHYETNLSDIERDIAYTYELQMYKNGHINGVSFRDSLFRGIKVYGNVVDGDVIKFERQLVNAQISNILSQSGINADEIPETCKFTVDPYTYEISVDGVGQDLKAAMENALNVGDNGKYLFFHINKCATQDGCNSTQVSSESYTKYRAYQEVYAFTGLKLNELTEKNGTYYTEDGQDILSLANTDIGKSDDVPKDYKASMKEVIQRLVSGIAKMGWNNVPDMRLSILFGQNGLKDINQSIIFQYDKTKKGYDDNVCYHVI
ncbi:MAG: DUF4885 family protein [Lachnospiraceae bacterium]|nr:DUF4885 family protein [Lachnospiraceae bacterium]